MGPEVNATTTPPPNPNLSPKPVTEVPEQPILTATRMTARPEKPEPKHSAAPKPGAGKSKKKATTGVKTAAAKPRPPSLVVSTQPSTSPLEDISDLDHLLQACVKLTRRLLMSIIFLATGAARPRALLKTVILFVAEYGQYALIGYLSTTQCPFRANPLGGYCNSSQIDRQTCVNPCGLPFAFLPTYRREPDRLFRRGNAGLDGW